MNRETAERHDLNDPLDDLLRGDGEVFEARPLPAPPPSYKAPEYFDRCPKCSGTGRYGNMGQCFACQGKGCKSYKTSHATRAKAREQREDRHDRKIEAFKAANPDVWGWMATSTFPFAVAMRDALTKYGDLTDNQLAASKKCIEKYEAAKVAKQAAAADRAAAALVVDTAGIDRLKAAFDAAAAYTASKAKGLTVRSPKITVGGITISPAKATSANPGALYVKAGQTYLGKIAAGRFQASRDCTPEQEKQVLAFVNDPAEAAKVYGQETGTCCICNAELRSEWRLRGIGPICAEKFGW